MTCPVMTKNFLHAPWGLAVPAQGNKQKKSCQEKIGKRNRFAVAGYHAIIWDAFILIYILFIFADVHVQYSYICLNYC